MSRQSRPNVPIRPAPNPSTVRSQHHQSLRPRMPIVPVLPIYAPSYAPTPIYNIMQPLPRIFTPPIIAAPPPVTNIVRPAQIVPEHRTPTPPPSLGRQSPYSRIAPSPTISTITTISNDDNVSSNN